MLIEKKRECKLGKCLNKLCFCVDYRKLKQITKCEAFLLPYISDLLSTLDLHSAYWQILGHGLHGFFAANHVWEKGHIGDYGSLR